MRIALFLCIFSTVLLNCVNGNNLEDVVGELSVVARLLNGISIQNDFVEHPENTMAVMAELLNISERALLDELNRIDVDSVMTSLTNFQAAVSGIPAVRTQNISVTTQALSLLEEMKNDEDALSTSITISTINDIKESLSNSDGEQFFSKVLLREIDPIFTAYNYFKSASIDLLGVIPVGKNINLLSKAFTDVIKIFDAIEQFQTIVPKFSTLDQTFDSLKGLIPYISLSKKYIANYNQIADLENQVSTLEEDLKDLKPLTDVQNFPEAATGVSRLLHLISKIIKPTDSVKRLTIGLPNGINDISLLLSELNNNKLLQKISDGRNWKLVADEMSSLKTFSIKMGKTEVVWKKLFDNSQLVAEVNISSLLTEALNNTQKITEASAVIADLLSVKNCVGGLKKVVNPVDYVKVEQLIDEVKAISQSVKNVKSSINSLASGDDFTNYKQIMNQWIPKIEHINENSAKDVIQNRFNEIVADTSLPKLSDWLKNTLIPTLSVFTADGTFTKPTGTAAKSEWALFNGTINALDMTNLKTTLTCFQSKRFDGPRMIGSLALRNAVEQMKVKNVEINKALGHFQQLSAVKKELENVASSVSRKSRRRRAATRGSFQLKSYQGISQAVGKGVSSLRNLIDIAKAENDIQEILSMDSTVHQAAESSNGEWNQGTRDQLSAIPPQLKTLETFAGEQKGKNLENLWSVFEEAKKVKGPNLNAKLLSKPIAEDLNKTSATQGASQKFRSISTLSLNFASHEANFQSASLSLVPIRDYFDALFGISGRNNNPKSEFNITDYIGIVIGIVVGIIGIVAVVFLGLYLKRFLLEKNNWKNRERYWQYCALFDKTMTSENIYLMIRNGNMDEVEDLVVRKKLYLNLYQRGETPLIHAVSWEQPDIVEMLIKAGADRDLKNDHGQTAEDIANSRMVLDEFGTLVKVNEEALKKCAEIFKKYRQNKFKHSTPKPLPWKEYKIFTLCSTKHSESFEKMYGSLLKGKGVVPTHVVVDVDKDGVYDLDAAECSHPDKLKELDSIFNTNFLVSHKWLKACVKNQNNFHRDHQHRVRKVRYEGKVYESVDFWKRWVRGFEIPCLHRVSIFYDTVNTYDNKKMQSMMTGVCPHVFDVVSTFIESVTSAEQRLPFWHPDKKVHILIRPTDKNKKAEFDRMFSTEIQEKCEVMTWKEFVSWLFSMKDFVKLAEQRDICVKRNNKIRGKNKASVSTSVESMSQTPRSAVSPISKTSNATTKKDVDSTR